MGRPLLYLPGSLPNPPSRCLPVFCVSTPSPFLSLSVYLYLIPSVSSSLCLFVCVCFFSYLPLSIFRALLLARSLFFLSIRPSLSLSFHLFLFLSLSFHPFLYLFVSFLSSLCLFVFLFKSLPLSSCPSHFMSVLFPSLCLSLFPSLSQSVCLSPCLPPAAKPSTLTSTNIHAALPISANTKVKYPLSDLL